MIGLEVHDKLELSSIDKLSRLSLSGSSNLKVEVKGPFWKQDNLLLPGHYEFVLQITKDTETISLDRRYSDFDLLRQALECIYPGLFIVPLPPKDKFITF